MKNNLIKRTCKYCKKEFFITKYRLKDKKVKRGSFCSKGCYHLNLIGKISPKRNKIKFNCDNCGEISIRIPAQYNTTKNHFCNNKCRQEWFKKKSKKIQRICKNCNKEFKIIHSRRNSAYYCSKVCYGESNRGDKHYKYIVKGLKMGSNS